MTTGKNSAGTPRLIKRWAARVNFARSFASWDRGSKENLNGLLRQYVTKKRQLENITGEEFKKIENRLNNRPRKRLGFITPAEVFNQSISRVEIRTLIRQ